MSLDDLKKAAKITGAAQDGFTVCIHSHDGERGYDHCFRIDKAIGAYLVALLHAHNDSSYVPSAETVPVPRAMLEKWRKELEPFWFSGNGEDEWNNEGVIEACNDIDALLAAHPCEGKP